MRLAFALLTLALLAGVVVGREKPAGTLLHERQPAQTQDIDLSRLEHRAGEAPANDPFARRSFGAAEAAATAAAPGAPARAEAPLLPFRYIGKVIDNGKVEILLLRGAEQYAAVPGDKLGPDYRLDKVSGTALTFTYLPLKTKQTLDIPK
jgi:hypothetical protein